MLILVLCQRRDLFELLNMAFILLLLSGGRYKRIFFFAELSLSF